jgi:hypothetical protein
MGILLLTPVAARGQSRIPHWRRWDEYQTVLWSTGTPSSQTAWPNRVLEAGFSLLPAAPGGQPAPGVAYYVENLVPELAFLHGRRALYDADWSGYQKTRDKRYLVRKPCFDDPAFWQQVTPRLAADAARNKSGKPLLYDLRDEASIGSFTSPMDYCFCPYTLRAFREWLKRQYASLAALNAEWQTSFARWDEAVPPPTFEMKDRERAGRMPDNYAPWADHRAYMDWSFAQALDRMRSILHRADPDTPVGIEGVQMPAAWGGYDLWQLSQAVDWMEPYDLANSREIVRAFLPPGAPVLSTYFDHDVRTLRRTAWARLLDGDRGAIVWDDDSDRVILKSAGGMPLTERGRQLRAIFAEVKTGAAGLAGFRRTGDGIAIHYSQASIRAHWMFDSREDGVTWLRRLASYEQEHSRYAQARNSFVRVVEDLGLTADFISYEQIEKGGLAHYKVLLLPQSVAMSAAECANIEAFARKGGVVIADNGVGLMDQHDRRRPAGCLDSLFGVRQKALWKAVADGGAGPLPVFDRNLEITGGARRGVAPEAPQGVRNGSAVYLNIDMRPYGALREAWPRGANYLRLFESLFHEAGIDAPVKVQGAHDIRVVRFERGGVERIALLRNPNPRKGAPPAAGDVRLHLTLARRARVSMEGRDLGAVDALDLDLHPWTAEVLELRDPAPGKQRQRPAGTVGGR